MKKYGLGLLLFISFALVFSVISLIVIAPQWDPISQGRHNITDPVSGSEYLPTRSYTFNITWNGTTDVDLSNVTNVTFITNITGSSVNYTINHNSSDGRGIYVMNGSAVFANFTINFTGVGPYEIVAYRWVARNSTFENATPEYIYNISIPGKVAPHNFFYVQQNILHLNFTNSFATNFTVFVNGTLNFSTTRIVIEVLNSSSISANYSQSNTITDCSNFNYKLFVTNVTSNSTTLLSFNSTNSSEIRLSLASPEQCLPGRYNANLFTIRNSSINTSINVNISLFADIPISARNSVNSNIKLNGNGRFSGSLPAYAPTYQSYYFNTSEVPNATGIVLNVSWTNSSQDLDVFLFDALGQLKEKSVNKTGTKEEMVLTYKNFTTAAMWEVRLYANSSASLSYDGSIIFIGLNSTNTSFNFPSPMNATNVTQVTFNITNEANLTTSSMNETKVLYLAQRLGDNATRNFTFLVPDSTVVSRIRISLNWTGDTNYSFVVYKPSNNTAHMRTYGNFMNANITGVNQEEFNETTDIVKGFWRVEVVNNTNSTSPYNPYNLTMFLYVNASEWITSNYTAFSFNRSVYNSVINNTNKTVQINFTVPNSTLDGTYEGYIKYESSNGGSILIPIKTTVRTAVLVVNNTINSSTIIITENIGFNITRTVNVTFNNNGSYDLPISFVNSTDLILKQASNPTRNISFNFTASNGTFAHNGTVEVLNLSFYINTTNTSNTEGVYESFVFFNTSNNSHPHQGFNLSLKVNLTNQLVVKISDIETYNSNRSIDPKIVNNATLRINVYWQNLTEISGNVFPELNASNFTSVYLVEGNVTNASSRVPSAGTLSVVNGTNIIVPGEEMYEARGGYSAYKLNISVPSGIPGGLYKARVLAHYLRGGMNYTGYGDNGTLVVYDAGFEMKNYTNSYSISNTSSDRLYVNVTNWGPVSKTASLAFVESCGGYSVTAESASSGCNTGTSGANFTDLDIAAHSSSCLLTFKITGSSGASACSGTLTPTPSNLWFNNFTVSVTVSGDSGAGTTDTTTTGTGTTTSTTTTAGAAPKYLEIVNPATVFVVQGSSNSTKITVKNINNTKTQNISLAVEDITQSWVTSISPITSDLVLAGSNTTFTITFSVPNTTEIKDYTGTLKASSSYESVVSSFVLRVLPSEEKKLEINNTFELIKLNYTKLQTELSELKERGVNVSDAQKILDEAKVLVQEAETHISNGDYFAAFQLFDQIKAKIEAARAELAKAPSGGIFDSLRFLLNPIYIVAIFAAVGGVVLLYLFWPTKLKYAPQSAKPKIIEKPKVVEDVWEKLKKKWEDYYRKRKLGAKQYYRYKGQQ